MSGDGQRAIGAIRAGGVAVLPTDTVYGLVADGRDEEAARRLYRLKGRDDVQPTAVLASSLGAVDELVGLEGRVALVAAALLPGPFTLVVPNPRRALPWLCGPGALTIGVRVPTLPPPTEAVLAAIGVLVATSANLPGGADPRALDEVPTSIRAAADAIVDGGVLPGVPSTVIDLSGDDARVLREGAVTGADALARIDRALAR